MDSEFAHQLSEQRALTTALLTVVTALIQTHPNATALQLQITGVLEGATLSGKPDSLGSKLTPRERDAVREAVEWLGSLRPQKPAAPQPGQRP